MQLAVPGGTPLSLTPLTVDRSGDRTRITVELDEATWHRVRDEQLFALDPEHAGRGFVGEVPGASYRMVLALADAEALAGTSDGAADLLRAVPRAEGWRAEDVQRELPLPEQMAPGTRLAEGYTTAWAPAATGLDAPLLARCREWFLARDMQATQQEDSTILRLDGNGANGTWVLWLETREQECIVLVWSSWPQEVPVDRRSQVMELITRINPQLAVGSFELDLERGQLSLRTSLELGDAPLHDDLIAGLVGANVEAFDGRLPALLAVLDGEEARTAVALV